MTIKITEEDYHEMCKDSGGFCLKCGIEVYGIEPDARRYTCEECDTPNVYGIEELLMMGKLDITEAIEHNPDIPKKYSWQ
jgi:hypothetical protein